MEAGYQSSTRHQISTEHQINTGQQTNTAFQINAGHQINTGFQINTGHQINPYMCGRCPTEKAGKIYGNRYDLEQHLAVFHKNSEGRAASKTSMQEWNGPKKCQFCDIVLARKEHIFWHVKRDHPASVREFAIEKFKPVYTETAVLIGFPSSLICLFCDSTAFDLPKRAIWHMEICRKKFTPEETEECERKAKECEVRGSNGRTEMSGGKSSDQSDTVKSTITCQRKCESENSDPNVEGSASNFGDTMKLAQSSDSTIEDSGIELWCRMCQFCGALLVNINDLTWHVRLNHPDMVKEFNMSENIEICTKKKNEALYPTVAPCLYCKAIFQYWPDMKRHMKLDHVFTCELCGVTGQQKFEGNHQKLCREKR